ncbi:MAG: copper resistance system multicopper oxidase [Gammaproteobacteria bacterium]
MHTRRRFVRDAALVGATGWLWRARAFAQSPMQLGGLPVLDGDRFDLTIGATPTNMTGRARLATTVNGSLPAPILRFREGSTLTINVTNRLSEPTSIHWHGILLPNAMDGVPGLTFRGIDPGETFTYRFPVQQSGTFWYHSHSGMQEQTGLYGPLIITPRAPEPYAYDREYVVMLSDWTDEDPMTVVSNLKQQGDYYNFQQRTLSTLRQDARAQGRKAAFADRWMWGKMRMSPTDIMDVTGATYVFLINGQPPKANWTGLFAPGERIRLRFINAASMTTFDVRIPGLPLSVVQADGNDVEPVMVDEFRIGVAETYDVIVTPPDESAYTIFAQAQDRSGYARGTLAPHAGMTAFVPPLDPRPLRTMADMGMGGMDMSKMDMSNMSAEDMAKMAAAMSPTSNPGINADGVDPKTLAGKPNVDNIAMSTKSRVAEAGTGLEGSGRRVLTYADLKSLEPTTTEEESPPREIEFHLTGNMERWVWGFDGKKFSEAPPVEVKLGERVRFILVNNTMMEHPIHLHGFFTALENGQGDRLPRKHTVNVKPGERLTYLFTADFAGRWAFHCHLLYHMETGMFRTVLVS